MQGFRPGPPECRGRLAESQVRHNQGQLYNADLLERTDEAQTALVATYDGSDPQIHHSTIAKRLVSVSLQKTTVPKPGTSKSKQPGSFIDDPNHSSTTRHHLPLFTSIRPSIMPSIGESEINLWGEGQQSKAKQAGYMSPTLSTYPLAN